MYTCNVAFLAHTGRQYYAGSEISSHEYEGLLMLERSKFRKKEESSSYSSPSNDDTPSFQTPSFDSSRSYDNSPFYDSSPDTSSNDFGGFDGGSGGGGGASGDY